MAHFDVKSLGPLQRQLIEFLWDRGPATVAELHERLGAAGHEVTYTTVLVALQKLEKKGWVQHRARGRAYQYSARVSRKQNRTSSLGELLHKHFAGDARELVSQLLELHPASDEELRELRQLIEQRRRELRHG
ncbi:MAG: BlaI/MecI/CopY family transcriptional regulator [Pirellulales bacterium]|nr:BlaI/MecI/CopY family transcriptional regulator [Pirellulales bacterium]